VDQQAGHRGQYLYFSRNSTTNGNIYRFNMFDIRDDAPLDTVLNAPVEESLSLLLAPDSTYTISIEILLEAVVS